MARKGCEMGSSFLRFIDSDMCKEKYGKVWSDALQVEKCVPLSNKLSVEISLNKGERKERKNGEKRSRSNQSGLGKWFTLEHAACLHFYQSNQEISSLIN